VPKNVDPFLTGGIIARGTKPGNRVIPDEGDPIFRAEEKVTAVIRTHYDSIPDGQITDLIRSQMMADFDGGMGSEVELNSSVLAAEGK